MQKAIISEPLESLACASSSTGEGWADWTATPGQHGDPLGACEPGLGVPLWLQHKGRQCCKRWLWDPLVFPLLHQTCLHTRTHVGIKWQSHSGGEREHLDGLKCDLQSHYPSENSRLPWPQQLLYVHQENRGQGRGKEGGLAFFVKRQFLHFRRKAETIKVSMAWQTQQQNLAGEEALSPPFVLLSLEQPHVRVQLPSTHGQVPGFMELTTFLHKVKTTTASVCGFCLCS